MSNEGRRGTPANTMSTGTTSITTPPTAITSSRCEVDTSSTGEGGSTIGDNNLISANISTTVTDGGAVGDRSSDDFESPSRKFASVYVTEHLLFFLTSVEVTEESDCCGDFSQRKGVMIAKRRVV